MKRFLYNNLLAWKADSRRKPLLLQGARQVGKTYLVSQFGNAEYANFVYLNFEQNPGLSTFFKDNLIPSKIIENIGLYLGKAIQAENTLIFFDEIQTTPEVLTSLKYFRESAPEYHIIAAGSLLGVSMGKKSSFPVGKVNFMMMYPMTFSEYLIAFGEEMLENKISSMNVSESLPDVLHQKLITHHKMYLYLGGMPEVLQNYLYNKDIATARAIQEEILQAYARDFSKYADKSQAIKTAELWQSIPAQLARERKKFKYSDVRSGARASTYEQTIEWLKSAGLINLAYQIRAPKIPLSAYADHSKFKVFLLDTGLLGAMLKLTSAIILEPTALFSEYNGAFTENFIAAELIASGYTELYYWASKSEAEVDFIVQNGEVIYPLEVKSGLNRNKRSLISYHEKYNPPLLFRCSPRNFTRDGNFINLPLYAAFLMRRQD